MGCMLEPGQKYRGGGGARVKENVMGKGVKYFDKSYP